jgi:PAS domain S-box-containing protein
MSANPSPSAAELLERLVGELAELAVVLISKDGRFTSWNPGVQKLFGYTEGDFVGRDVDVLFPEPDRSRRPGHSELQTALRNGLASDTRWLARHDGTPVFVNGFTLSLRDNEGEHVGYGKVMHDVTETRNAEQGLKALAGALDQSTVVIRTWDGVIEHWTSGCERLYGWSAEEAVGKIAEELLNTKYPHDHALIQRALIEQGTWQGELHQIRKDGSHVTVLAQWALLSNENDEPRIIISTHSDITALAQVQKQLQSANARLQQMAQELERSNEELEEFARIASHDLSAPITSTRWLVDLLAARHAGQLDAEGRKCVQQIGAGLERMADLVEAVLAHARVGRTAIGSGEHASAEEALNEAIENLRGDIEISSAVITHDRLPELRIGMQPLTRLLQNLLSNAMKYARPNVPPRVHVSATREGEDSYSIAVRDNGIGIDPLWFERIFQPMQRLHGLDIAGSGIGLATCKKIVTRAGGRIWVESTPGAGSTFCFTLPGSAPAQEPEARSES